MSFRAEAALIRGASTEGLFVSHPTTERRAYIEADALQHLAGRYGRDLADRFLLTHAEGEILGMMAGKIPEVIAEDRHGRLAVRIRGADLATPCAV